MAASNKRQRKPATPARPPSRHSAGPMLPPNAPQTDVVARADASPTGPMQGGRGRWWLFFQNDAIAGFTAWLAVVTAALVFVTALLALISAFQAWAFIKSERAFVYPVALSVDSIVANMPIESKLLVENKGRSTAEIEEFNTVLAAIGNLPDTPNYVQGGMTTRNSVAPGSQFLLTVVPSYEFKLDDAHLAAVREGKIKLYIYGHIAYKDEFSFWPFGSRDTGFCYQLAPNKNGTAVNFLLCKEPHYLFAR